MKSLIFIFAVMILISGCIVSKNYAITDGKKSDGTVEVSYEIKSSYGLSERPIVNYWVQQANTLAEKHCSDWGYSGTKSFGEWLSQCTSSSSSDSCKVWKITRKYQCFEY